MVSSEMFYGKYFTLDISITEKEFFYVLYIIALQTSHFSFKGLFFSLLKNWTEKSDNLIYFMQPCPLEV